MVSSTLRRKVSWLMQLEGFHRSVLIIAESTGQSIGKTNPTLTPPLPEDQRHVLTVPEVMHHRLAGGEDGATSLEAERLKGDSMSSFCSYTGDGN